MTSGGQCVMTIGISGMLRWCAEPWTVGHLMQPSLLPILVQVMQISGWMTWNVRVMRRPFCTATTAVLAKITVAMARMPA